MNKLAVVIFSSCALANLSGTSFAAAGSPGAPGTQLSGSSSDQIQQLNTQIQGQLKQMQAQQQQQIDKLNSQVQNQLRQIQSQMQDQIQKANSMAQNQIKQVQATLQQQIKLVHEEVMQNKGGG